MSNEIDYASECTGFDPGLYEFMIGYDSSECRKRVENGTHLKSYSSLDNNATMLELKYELRKGNIIPAPKEPEVKKTDYSTTKDDEPNLLSIMIAQEKNKTAHKENNITTNKPDESFSIDR